MQKRDAERRRIWVELIPLNCDQKRVEFWVDFFDFFNLFDFPLSTFARISPFERVAVLFDNYGQRVQYAQLTLLYFPSSRSAAKDKPYIEDLVTQLRARDEPGPAVGAAASAAASANSAGK